MGNITSSSSKETIPTAKQENTKQDVTSSIDRGGRDNSSDERVAKRPRFTENDHIIDKVHNTEDEQKHITNTVSPSLTAHSMPGGLLLGSNNDAVADATSEEVTAVAKTRGISDHSSTPTPSLVGMPASIIIKIIQYSTCQSKCGGYISPDFRPDILALERTCKAFKDLLSKDKTWEEISWKSGDYEHAPTAREYCFFDRW